MNSYQITKRPADTLDYDFDFSRWLPEGDTIASATATLDADATVTIHDITWSNSVARVWLAGGTNLSSCQLLVTITTLAGRVKEVAAAVRIKDDA